MIRTRSVCVLAAAAALAPAALACIWDRDTLRDETRQLPGVFDLITGQFEHHGSGYYEARLDECRRTLGSDNVNPQVRNDLGVALLKLGRYEESLAVFRKLEAEDPQRYETLSNLGVLFKKMDRFEDAAIYTEKALALRPEGHLGMRDFYLKMLRWRAERADAPETVPERDFLGRAYSGWLTPLSDDDFERLLSLIRSDKTFADAYVALGDHLFLARHRNLAFWAWVRALHLGHPAAEHLKKRLTRVFDYWKDLAQRHEAPVHGTLEEAIAAVTADIVTATAWQKTFEAVEGEMVRERPGVQFEDVFAELDRRGIPRFAPTEHGLRDTMAEEIAAQKAEAQEAADRKVRAAAEAKARTREAQRVRDEAYDRKAKRSFWWLSAGALGAALLAGGVMALRRG